MSQQYVGTFQTYNEKDTTNSKRIHKNDVITYKELFYQNKQDMFGDELKELTPKNLIFVINEKLTKFYIHKLTEIKESLNKNFIFPMNIFLLIILKIY